MGGISIIARRLSPKHVQYGWSGNGGRFWIVGARLLEWYDNPSIMDYLFGLGQLQLIGKPGPFRIKIPLWYVAKHLDERDYEFDGVAYVIKQTMDYLLKEYIPADKELLQIADSYKRPYDEIVKQVLESEYPDHEIFDHYHLLYKAMDDWIVVKTDEEYENITRIIMKKDQGEDNRIETVEWD